jgi:spermidine synthase
MRPVALVDAVLYLCFFFSGASGLVYEVVWLRWLVHVFGATTLAVSTILTAFMGGLALGSWLAGRWAARVARPLLAYGLLELAIGAYALGLPALLHAVAPTLSVFGATEASSFAALSLARFVLAVLLLTVPTACMGATLPILAQFIAPRIEGLGSRVGRLYAVNTTGAVLGTAAAGFVLLPTVGVALTNLLAVALNVAVGVTALLVGWKVRGADVPAAAPAAAAAPPALGAADPGAPDLAARRTALAALAAVAVSGALSMVYEVGWTRALALVLGSSVYAFTVMLTTFLVGLAAGSYLLARRVDRLADPGMALAVIQLLIGAAAFVGLVILDELPYVFVRVFALSGGRHGLLLALEFLISGSLILLPALLAGAVFPICVRLTAAAGARVGRTVGNLYALNTVGAIVGSFAAGFVLVPSVGVRGTLVLAILLNLACAFLLFVGVPARRRSLALALAAGVPVAALAVPVLAPDWNPLTMSSGVAVYAPSMQRLSRAEFQAQRQTVQLLSYEEGLTTSVSVEEAAGHVFLRLNGKTDASTAADMPTQVLVGHIPLLLHQDPKDVVVIGFGSGVTIGSALRHPIRSATIVELEGAVIRAGRFFEHVNNRPLADPRARLVINDARNFLLLTRDRFDVIISEPSNPWLSGVASLFTREFFQLARDHLRPGGIFAHWLQLYSLTPEVVRTVLATFNAVFPEAVVFQTTGGDTLLVGSLGPPQVTFHSVVRRITPPAVAEDLRRVGVRDVEELFARLVLDVEDVPRFAAGAPLNTDDNAYVEFTAPVTLYVNAIFENGLRLAHAFTGGGSVLGRLTREAPEGFAARLGHRFLAREQAQQAEAHALAGLRAGGRADLAAVAAHAAAARGDAAEAERRWQAVLRLDPTSPEGLLGLAAELEARGELREARVLAQRAEARGGTAATLREAELLARLQAPRDADALLARLPADAPGVPLAHGGVRLALGDAAGAERLFRKAIREHDDGRARAGLAAALDQLGRAAEARHERRRAVELDGARGFRYLGQARVRARLGLHAWAEYDMRRARDLMPWNAEAHEERARLLERMGDRRRAIEAWEETARAFPANPQPLLALADLWEAEGDARRARDALQRYVAAEPNGVLRQRAELYLKRMAP